MPLIVYEKRPAVKKVIRSPEHYRDNCRLPQKEKEFRRLDYGANVWMYYQIYRRKADQALNRSIQYRVGSCKEDFYNRYLAYSEVADEWADELSRFLSWLKYSGMTHEK